MKDIIIVCAGAYGLELLSVIRAINDAQKKISGEPTYRVLGFIDDNLSALDDKNIPYNILGRIADWTPKENELYVIGAAFPKVKEKLSNLLKGRGCRFETIIAPWSIVSPECSIGEGCFITAYSISAGVKLGNFVNINASMICPGSVIDDYSTTTGFSVVDNAKVGKRVFIGSHAVISPHVSVGDGANISVGSIVMEDIPANATVFGCPAVQIG